MQRVLGYAVRCNLAKWVVMFAVLCAAGTTLLAQSNDQKPQQPTAAQPAQLAAPRPDSAQQIQLDLDQMESLVNNMAAQVSFIRDTNMSILLNTNVRLWTVLIRDLRMQLQEQQKHVASPK